MVSPKTLPTVKNVWIGADCKRDFRNILRKGEMFSGYLCG
jgi:hypothetical protein